MILSSDELEVLEYLKSWSGKYVSMMEICRSAGGRRKFKENPNWAKSLMDRLVEANLAQVNERGHYRIPVESKSETEIHRKKNPSPPAPAKTAVIVGDNYFPAPTSGEPELPKWLAPHLADILKKSGKKFSGSKH